MRHILVTGGSGFIGHNIAESLSGEFSLLVPTHKELDLVDSQLLGRYMKVHNIDTIIHAATGDRFGGFGDSIRMFASILEQGKAVKQIIHFGSGAEYDKRRNLIRVKETEFGEHLPVDEYGLAKYFMSLLAKSRANIVTLRLFGVYGPHEDYRSKFISNTIAKELFGLPIVIKQNVVFDYLYIDDLTKILTFILKRPMRHAVYNVTPDESISLSQIAGIIKKISGNKTPFTILNSGYNFQYTGDNLRLRKEIPTFKFHTYEEGIEKLYAYYKSHKKELSKTVLKMDDFLARSLTRKNT